MTSGGKMGKSETMVTMPHSSAKQLFFENGEQREIHHLTPASNRSCIILIIIEK